MKDRLGELLHFLERSALSPLSGDMNNQSVRLVRHNGSDFIGSLRVVSLLDTLEILSSCVAEFRTQAGDDHNSVESRGFRLIRNEADYLAVSVVGHDEAYVTTDFLSYRNSVEAVLATQQIHFSAEIEQVTVVLEQYFFRSREEFENSYHEYLVSYIGDNPPRLVKASVPTSTAG